MHLSPVTPTCSIPGRGGLPTHPHRIRGSVCDGEGLPGLPGSTALADRISLPPVHRTRQLGDQTSLHDVQRLRAPNLRHRWDGLSPKSPSLADLVPCHVVGHQPKARGQRAWIAEAAGAGELSDGLGLAAEAPARHDASRPGLACWPGRGGRGLRRRRRDRRGGADTWDTRLWS